MPYRIVFCCFKRKVRIKQIKVKQVGNVPQRDKPVVYGYSKRYNYW